MSNFDERNNRPTEKLTLAGIAAIIVVGVFVVCIILVLAKSLFPSNDDEVDQNLNTGTKPTASSVVDTASADDESSTGGEIVPDTTASQPDPNSAAMTESAPDTSSIALGEVAVLTQTAYLRSAGDENAEPLLSVSAGEEVTILDRPAGSEYVHVNYLGYDGYIWYGYLG